MLDPSSLPALPSLLSTPRFQTYLDACEGRQDVALRLYAWNVEVTSAFWGPISILEVVVRNAMHDALRAGRQDDWWNCPSLQLMARERKNLLHAQQTLDRRGHPSPTAGQVVAATTFGLWVGLTAPGLPRHPHLSYETAIWQPRLVRAFPHAGTVRRKQLHRALDDVRNFRNRLAHHEPVFAAPLERIRDQITGLAGFVDPAAAEFITGTHRIDDALARKHVALTHGRSVI
jgi:hypothetical protein